MNRPKTKILVDGGDPAETLRIKQLFGFVDGQTTNPTLISKNPHIKQLLDSGHKLSEQEELNEYKKIVREISPLLGDAGVSIEVFADFTTTAESMLEQGREMFSWKRMLAKGDRHLLVLAASIRSVEQLLYCFVLEADLVTVPAKVLEKWAEYKFPMPQRGFVYQSIGRPIAYQELSLDQPWQSYDLRHELTEKGIRKFVEDYRKTVATL